MKYDKSGLPRSDEQIDKTKNSKSKKIEIICVSRNDSGREHWTGLLEDCPDDIILGLLGEGDDAPEFQASLYLGTLADLEASRVERCHASHTLSRRCEELCLGDYV